MPFWWLAFALIADAQVPALLRFVPGPIGGTGRQFMAHEDANGFLWIGTDRGLVRFDGVQYAEIENAEIPALQGRVTSMYRDRRGMLWAGFQDGTIARLRKGRQWELWAIPEGFPKAPITGFAESRDSLFWIATYGEGLYFHNGKYLYAFSEEEGLPSPDIYALTDNDGEVWAASDAGIVICSVEAGSRKIRRLGIAQGLPDPVVTALAPDGKGNCWVGMYEGGIAFYDARADAFFCQQPASAPFGEIKSIALWPEKALFIGTENGQVHRLDLLNGNLELIEGPESLPKKDVSGLHLGREGHLSIFYRAQGHYETNVQFNYLRGSKFNTQALVVDRKRQIWAGTPDGLFSAKGQLEKFQAVRLPPHNFISLYEDYYGNIWAGTFGQGLYVLPAGGGKPLFFEEQNGISNNSILRISGNEKEVWLATLGGATCFQIKGDAAEFPPKITRIMDPSHGLSAHFLYTVFADSRGRVWFGSDGKGVSCLQHGQITTFSFGLNSKGDTIPFQSVYAITEGPKNSICISTSRKGLFVETEHGFSLLKNIAEREIIALEGDGSAHLLASYEGGFEWMDMYQGQSIEYSKGAGIDNLQPNLNALFRVDGRFLMGTTQGILTFSPIETTSVLKPVVVLEGVSTFLEPIDWSIRNKFSAKENALVFSFTGIWRTDPAHIRFRYRLSGHNEDWIYTSDRQASFPKLPPGKYSFEVEAGVGNHFYAESNIRYDFRIQPPIWLQPWFMLLIVAAAIALLASWIKRREKLLQREMLRRKEIGEMQFELLKSQVNPHFLFNSFNTLITLIEEDSQGAITYVEKLSDFFRNILKYRDVELIPLEEEIKILHDYLFLLDKRFGPNLQVELQNFQLLGYIAPLTLQLLVENAVKHNVISRSKKLLIKIERNLDELIVENAKQARLQAAESTGFGLANIKKRYSLLDSRPVQIESSAQFFRVRIPIINSTDHENFSH